MLFPAEEVFKLMNVHGSKRQPFLFGIDFAVRQGFFLDPSEAGEAGIYFNINGIGNSYTAKTESPTVQLVKHPAQLYQYKKAFNIVYRNLVEGNSYLANLTFPTAIDLNISLQEVYSRSKARYRIVLRMSL
jgi:para-aminobenzoate synthetase component 1